MNIFKYIFLSIIKNSKMELIINIINYYDFKIVIVLLLFFIIFKI